MARFSLIAICLFLWTCLPGNIAVARINNNPFVDVNDDTNSQKAPDKSLSLTDRELPAHRSEEETQNKPGARTRSVYMETEEESDITSLFRNTDVQDFDIPIVFNDAVEYYIKYFAEKNRKVFGNWLKRSEQHVPMITEILRKENIPEDLVYLAMIESGFNPKAYSPAKASGPWQFIAETGRRYGLTVNYWVDERRDLEKSTVAAAKYLGDLFDQFGSWYLAAAGYNAGESRVVRAIKKHNTDDFWEIHKYNTLPRETRNYIPQLIAAAIIAKEPERYGFENITHDTPLRFVSLTIPASTPLSVIARASSIDLGKVKAYNPAILRGVTPPGTNRYEIKLPDSVDRIQFFAQLQGKPANTQKTNNVTAYRVKKGDTLTTVAKRYGVTVQEIRAVNNWNKNTNLNIGMTIAMPRSIDDAKVVATAKLDTSRQASTRKTTPEPQYHTVKKGETLASISDRYDISVTDLKLVNKLKSSKLLPDTKLKLASYTVKKEMVKITYHRVQRGESLSSISNKYGVEIDDIKSANQLKYNKIQVGMRLKIVLNRQG
jgi:membrane-bound lytic murein transglycosylase D